MAEEKITIKSTKNAVWKYLTDHGHKNKDGNWEIKFIIKGKKRFFGRVANRRKMLWLKK